jgi:hypothetical protein
MEQRAVVRFLAVKGFKADEIRMELTSVYGGKALRISALKN